MTEGGPRPRVSAIIPAYNAQAYLGEAIESVLAQTHQVSECLVVDDGSNDGTAMLASAFGAPVRVVHQQNSGVSAARNRGVRESAGELLAFLDADDRWLPGRIEAGVEALVEGVDAVLCGTRIVDRELRPIGVLRQDPRLDPADLLLCRGTTVSVSSNLLIRREAFERLGGFDESLSTSADWALGYRILERAQLVVLGEPLVEYRHHEANMSADVDRFRNDMLRAFDGVFSRPDAPLSLRRRAYASLHRMIAGSYFVERRPREFLRHAAWSVAQHPPALLYFLGMPWRRLRRRPRR